MFSLSLARLNCRCVYEIITQLITKHDTTKDIKILKASFGITLFIKIQIAAKQDETKIALIGTECLFSFFRRLQV